MHGRQSKWIQDERLCLAGTPAPVVGAVHLGVAVTLDNLHWLILRTVLLRQA